MAIELLQKNPVLELDSKGLYCAAGNFYIDPWKPVESAVITHAHADHASMGHQKYLASNNSEHALRTRLGADINLQTLPFGKKIKIKEVTVSLHPAGHVLGSAQVRVEHRGVVWVVTGDYKLEADPTCEPFEPVKCDVFITEATFALPVYRWEPSHLTYQQINEWWTANNQQGITSVIFSYAFGKAQRVLAGLERGTGRIFTHGAVENLNVAYRKSGVSLPDTTYVGDVTDKKEFKGGLVIAPPSAHVGPYLRRFGTYSTAFASGWMLIRGKRRRKSLDRGFVLSDHADWQGLITAIKATDAEVILPTHGYTKQLSHWLNENGWQAQALETNYSPDEELIPEDLES